MTLSKFNRRALGTAAISVGVGGLCWILSLIFHNLENAPMSGQVGLTGLFDFLVLIVSLTAIILGLSQWEERSSE